jgi:anti-anti-sigma factor
VSAGGVARQSVRPTEREVGLALDIRRHGTAVRVTLRGILDRKQLHRLVSELAPWLECSVARVILEGQGLRHVDYRAVGLLVTFGRRLRRHGHELMLQGWNDYLRAILRMEDWDRELQVTTLRRRTRLGGNLRPGRAP